MVLAQHSSAKQLIPRFRVFKEKFSNLSGVSMNVDENDSVVKNCWNVNLKRRKDDAAERTAGTRTSAPTSGVHISPQTECAHTREAKKEGRRGLLLGDLTKF